MNAVRFARALVVVATCTALTQTAVAGQDPDARSFDRVQYLGGMVGFRGTSPRWDNTLTISATSIAMRNKDSALLFEMNPSQMANLQYLKYGSNESSLYWFVPMLVSPIATGIAAGVAALVSGGAPPGLRNGDHFIAIEYFFADCQRGALLLRANKKNYKDVIAALTGTGKRAELARASVPHACVQKPDDNQPKSDSHQGGPADSR